MNTSRKKSHDRELAEMITAALEKIESHYPNTIFVKAERVMRRKSLRPTEHQQSLYNWIRRKGFVERELTLGMHYGMLGGLMARGLVVPTTKHGKEGVEAA